MMENNRSMRGAAAGLLALFVAIAVSTAGMAEEKPMDRSVTVTGSASVEAVPDLARVTSGLVSEAATASAALAANSETMAALITGLKAAGVETKDIATGSFRVEPRYTHESNGRNPKMDGYQVNNEVAVTVRDLSRLGRLLDEMVKLGANRIGGLSFEVSGADKLKDEARRLAVADARRKAELYAKAAGAEVGAVLRIAEEGEGMGLRPQFAARAAMAGGVPIERGTQSLEAHVTVTWGLR